MFQKNQPLEELLLKSNDVTNGIIKYIISRHTMREVTTGLQGTRLVVFSELHDPCMLFRERISDEIECAVLLV